MELQVSGMLLHGILFPPVEAMGLSACILLPPPSAALSELVGAQLPESAAVWERLWAVI